MLTPEFKLVGGHPSLDLVNTLDNRFSPDGPIEFLNSYSDLLRFAAQTNLIDPTILANIAAIGLQDLEIQALDRALALREAIANLHYGRLDFQAPSKDDLVQLSDFHQVVTQRRQLAPTQTGFEWKWVEAEFDVSLPVWALAASAGDLLTSPEISSVHACDCPTCRWLFLDTSKNRARRWCDMKLCGNRMKAQRFQNRRAGAEC